MEYNKVGNRKERKKEKRKKEIKKVREKERKATKFSPNICKIRWNIIKKGKRKKGNQIQSEYL